MIFDYKEKRYLEYLTAITLLLGISTILISLFFNLTFIYSFGFFFLGNSVTLHILLYVSKEEK